MGGIRFFEFGPKTIPPAEVNKMQNWFQDELKAHRIEPVDLFEMGEQGLQRLSGTRNEAEANEVFLQLNLTRKFHQQFRKKLPR